jgi:hypothetical protein
VDASAVGVAAGILLISAAAVVVSSIAVSPSTVTAGAAVVIYRTVPTTGSASCLVGEETAPISTDGLFPPAGSGPPAGGTAGGSFWIRYTVPNSTPTSDYRVGLRCGGGDPGLHPTLRVIDPATRVATSAPQPGPSGADRSADLARWRVLAGVLIIGVAAFLGVAQWQPKRRRKD